MSTFADGGSRVDMPISELSVKTGDVFRRSPWQFLAVQAMTFCRFALVIPIVVLLYSDHWFDLTMAFVLSLGAHWFDYADGYYARKWKVVSHLGRFADPMADKAFFLTALIALNKFLKLQLIIVIVVVELFLFAHRVLVLWRAKKSDVSANRAGKLKAIFQCAVVSALIAGQGLEPVGDGSLTVFFVDWLGHLLLYASLGLSFLSLGVHLHRHGIIRLH